MAELATARIVNAAIYARVSTKKEQQQSSNPSQIHMCRDRGRQLGYNLREEWIHSDDETGRNMDRPGWQAILRLMEARVIQVVIVKDRSRISRNQRDYWRLKEEYLSRYGVEILPLSGIQVDPDNIWTEFAEEDEVREAERFSRILADKTRRGRRARLAQGYYTTFPPFGCMPGPEKGIPVKDPDNWPVLEEMFRMAAAGQTVGEIRAWLTDNGHKASRGGGWSATSVSRVLDSPFYRGTYVDNEGNEWPLRHECLVDEDLWLAARARDRRVGRPVAAGGGSVYVHLLPRVVSSHYSITHPVKRAGQPVPMRKWYARGSAGRYIPYYRRADTVRASGGVCAVENDDQACSLRRNVRADKLDELVLERLMDLYRDEGRLMVDLEEVMRHGQLDVERRGSELQRRMDRLQGELTRLDRSILRIADAGAADMLEVLRPLNSRRSVINDELAALGGELRSLSPDVGKSVVDLVRRRVNALDYVATKGTREELATLVHELVDHVDLRIDCSVVVLRLIPNRTLAAPTGLEPVFPP